MNKNLLAITAVFSGIALSYSVSAAQNNGGFTGPSVEMVSVEQAKNMQDEAFVVLQGNIKQNIGEEMYVFVDSSGTINVEIDEEDWNGAKVGPEDIVEIRGEIDKGWTDVEIDVDQITKIAPVAPTK